MATGTKKEIKVGTVRQFLPSHSYTGYQLHLTINMKDESSDICFKYLIYIMQKWLYDKQEKEMPYTNETYKDADLSKLGEFELKDSIYHIETVLSHDFKEWALTVKEPDADSEERKAVQGRLFITDAAIKIIDDKNVEFGCRIVVIDPEGAKEVDYAFRPKFIRDFFEDEKLSLKHGGYKTNKDIYGLDEKSISFINKLINAKEIQMPLVVITQPSDKEKTSKEELIDKFIKENPLSTSILNSPQPNSIYKPEKDNTKTNIDLVSEVMKHDFGYALDVYIMYNAFEKWKKASGINEKAGCVCIVYPKKYNLKSKIYPYSETLKNSFLGRLKNETRQFQKHKNYDFGSVVFQNEIRNENENARIEKLLREKEKLTKSDYEELLRRNRALEQELKELNKKTAELEIEKNNEFARAENMYICELDTYSKKTDELKSKIKVLTRDTENKNRKIEELKNSLNRKGDLVLKSSGLEHWYTDEEYDLIINMLQFAKDSYCVKGSRSEEIIENFLENNKIKGYGIEIFEEIEKLLMGNGRFNESIFSELEKCNFTISRKKNSDGHYNIKYRGKNRYTFEASSTPGDTYSGMKNLNATIQNKINIYKNPNLSYKSKLKDK